MAHFFLKKEWELLKYLFCFIETNSKKFSINTNDLNTFFLFWSYRTINKLMTYSMELWSLLGLFEGSWKNLLNKKTFIVILLTIFINPLDNLRFCIFCILSWFLLVELTTDGANGLQMLATMLGRKWCLAFLCLAISRLKLFLLLVRCENLRVALRGSFIIAEIITFG